jgi:DNA-binding NarL/FixJ family response regulator
VIVRTFVTDAHAGAVAMAASLLAPCGIEVAVIPDSGRRKVRQYAVRPTLRKGLGSLSDVQAQVLQLIAQGLPNREIGRALGISEDTVKTHTGRLYRKLGAHDRANAVLLGSRRGLIGDAA